MYSILKLPEFTYNANKSAYFVLDIYYIYTCEIILALFSSDR